VKNMFRQQEEIRRHWVVRIGVKESKGVIGRGGEKVVRSEEVMEERRVRFRTRLDRWSELWVSEFLRVVFAGISSTGGRGFDMASRDARMPELSSSLVLPKVSKE
jgi:hypothetical protein